VRIAFSIIVGILTALPVFADEASDAIALAPPQYRQQLAKQFSLAGANRAQLVAALRTAEPEHREAMAVLLAHMPQCDLTTLGKDLLLADVKYACKARAEMPWGKGVKDELFFNYVLPYATVNERRDEWRKDFYQRFAAPARQCRTPTDAALLLNKEVYAQLKVKFHPTKRPKTEQSPYESAEAGYASCTGMSILLIDACRSVGIPARLVGSPAWTEKTANHSWVEIWDRQWRPIDAGEAGPFDEAWVKWVAARIDPKRRDHCVYAVSFLPAQTSFPFIWAPDNHDVPADDVTSFYTARKRVTLRVVDRPGGQPIPAKVAIRCKGRLVAEENVHEPVAFFLAAGTTYDLSVRPFGSTQEIGRQVHIRHDHDEATVVHVNAYAHQRQPGKSQVAVRWKRSGRRRVSV
jgi:hypothetical protein